MCLNAGSASQATGILAAEVVAVLGRETIKVVQLCQQAEQANLQFYSSCVVSHNASMDFQTVRACTTGDQEIMLRRSDFYHDGCLYGFGNSLKPLSGTSLHQLSCKMANAARSLSS